MKEFKAHHFWIPAIAISILLAGKLFSMYGMPWYNTLNLPWFTPPRWAFPIVWNIIYILTTISAIIVWDTVKNGKEIKWLYGINAGLNLLWTVLFFYFQLIGAALFDAVLIGSTVVLLILLVWPVNRLAAWLLTPYLLWTAFAIVLNYNLWMLN